MMATALLYADSHGKGKRPFIFVDVAAILQAL